MRESASVSACSMLCYSKANVDVAGKTYSLLPTMLKVRHCQKTVHGKGGREGGRECSDVFILQLKR